MQTTLHSICCHAFFLGSISRHFLSFLRPRRLSFSLHSNVFLVMESTRMLRGRETELLHIGGEPARLFLLSGDRFGTSQCFKSGDLSMHFIRASGSPVAMASCMVGDHNWMLAKDSKVLKVEQRAFLIALPGFLYGLVLPSCTPAYGERLEEVFKRFCAYHDLLTMQESELEEEVEAKPDLWMRAYTRIEKLVVRSTGKVLGAAEDEFTARKLQKAVRTSALVKLVSHTLLSSSLSPLKHIYLAVSPGCSWEGNCSPYVLPSMWTFASLLDAMETGRLLPLPQTPKLNALAGQGGCWYFNREGMAVLLELMKAHGGLGRGRMAKKPRLDPVVEEAEEKCHKFGVGGDGGGEMVLAVDTVEARAGQR